MEFSQILVRLKYSRKTAAFRRRWRRVLVIQWIPTSTVWKKGQGPSGVQPQVTVLPQRHPQVHVFIFVDCLHQLAQALTIEPKLATWLGQIFQRRGLYCKSEQTNLPASARRWCPLQTHCWCGGQIQPHLVHFWSSRSKNLEHRASTSPCLFKLGYYMTSTLNIPYTYIYIYSGKNSRTFK